MTTAAATTLALLADTGRSGALRQIMEVYLTVCVCLMPLSLFLNLRILRRNPGIARTVSDAVDRLFEGGKGNLSAQEPSGSAPSLSENAGNARHEEPLTLEERIRADNAKNGIANIGLRVGDHYRCFLSAHNRRNADGNCRWMTDNPFICSIQDNGLFTAIRTGSTYVMTGNGSGVYYMEIAPRNPSWFALRALEDVRNGTCADEVRSRTVREDMSGVTYDCVRRTLHFETPRYSVSYQFGTEERTCRVLMRIPSWSGLVETIGESLAEHMELISGQDGECLYWYHRTSDRNTEEFPDSVDMIAFVHHTQRGFAYFGIGQSWRDGAGSGEIGDNLEMARMTFSDLLDAEDVPDGIGLGLKGEEVSTERTQCHGEPDAGVPEEDGSIGPGAGCDDGPFGPYDADIPPDGLPEPDEVHYY